MRKETDSSGTIRYYNDLNQLHREDGPASEHANGSKYWYRNGQYHREDGPAIEDANGDKSWYLNGKELTETEHKQQTNKSPDCNGKVVEIDGKKYELKLVS